MTSKKLGIALLSLAVLAIFAVAPVVADPSATENPFAQNIAPKDRVFVGESGLNITVAMDYPTTRIIAWWAPGTSTTDAPEKTLEPTPNEVREFYVDKATFETRTGSWYRWTGVAGDAAGELAFVVEKPSLNIGLYREDQTTSVDGKKLVANEDVTLRIDSTFAPLFKRIDNGLNVFYDDVVYNYTAGAFFNITDATYQEVLANLDAHVQTNATERAWALDNVNLTRNPSSDYDPYGNPINVGGINVYVVTPNKATLTSTIYVPNPEGPLTEPVTLQALKPDVPNYAVPGIDHIPGAPIWSAGQIIDSENVLGHKILTGEYQFYGEINLNGLKDNLGTVTGQTRSNTATVTIDKETITITADKATVIRNNGFSVKVEGNPKALYAVWFTGLNGYSYAEVPAFVKNQKDVVGMNITQAKNTSYKKASYIADDLPKGVADPTDKTPNYAVIGKTDASGVINIGIVTTESTKDTTYTIRAQRIEDDTLTPPLNSFTLDPQLYDTVKVKVEKGAVTISASGDGSYYLGEEITLSGTNTDSDDIYLFITGPNLPSAGGKLDSPKEVPTPTDDGSTKITVKTDDTWEYKWDTSGSILDAGTYTVYATSAFALKSGNATLSNAKYDTVSVVIKKPFVTATTSASTVAKGDKLYIRGTAEGEPTQGVNIWILGKNYWNGENSENLALSTAQAETVNDDGSFEYELSSADTKDLASGQYFVVVQHPMYNGRFDVFTEATDALVRVITNPDGALVTDKADQGSNGVAFIIAGNKKLQGSDAAEALITAINSANVDDTYTKLTFLVEEPWIRVNSVGDHYIGDQFKITGTTNLAIGDNLIVEVTSSSFQPTQKTQSGEFSGVSSTVKVNEGSSYNEWALDVDASTFKADEYIVNVEAIEADVTTTTTFNILTGSATVAPTSGPTTAPTTAPTSAPTTAPTPAATASPGFGALVALIGLGAVAALIIRKD